jgi:group I intron endonuclease
MIEKKFNFVYITTNTINGKQYIGDHSCDVLEKDNYLGSGKAALIPAIKKYGKENFKKEILEFFPTKQEAFNAQEKYINKHQTLAPCGYNISPKGGSQCSGGISEETKRNMSKSARNRPPVSEESKEKNRKAHLGNKNASGKRKKEFCEKMKVVNTGNKNAKGKRTPEQIENIRSGTLIAMNRLKLNKSSSQPIF